MQALGLAKVATRWVAGAIAFAGLAGGAALAQDGRIGVASTVVRTVTGDAGGTIRQLSPGAQVFSDETIQTAERSNSQLMFRDETTLNIGPGSSVVLDRFVFDPSGQANAFSVEAARGALRFVSGSSQPQAYTVQTPIATIGIRGTIVDLFVFTAMNYVILTEGAANVRITAGGQTTEVNLVKPGTYIAINANGVVTGPIPYNGELRQAIGPISFPLYGWSLSLQRGPRFFVGDERLGQTDQLDGREIQERGLDPCRRCR